ncbi:hypothetical protein Ade02nite_03540 [Paractinoplanes deccanensis]|uniref:Xaa-Pro dipeptidyl-peptidase C-terminal domain-containing protein n=1 Tax=Paractinoplanes deccanensis TaxID=113561 RepID=A0ABQ3XVD0_9ACTN|nr:CocE/NonD family hydrolase [Actinoplanes deccanensis]GID71713.1 hypothetical protein Ade02nite_03540 [Actinoplanes deccanensis]
MGLRRVFTLPAAVATALALTAVPASAAGPTPVPASAAGPTPVPASAAGPTPVPAAAAGSTTGFDFVDIPGDGVTLKANVIAPSTAGPHPAVLLPASWGLNDLEYLAQARTLASAGYVVVSYTPRGWWSSGGEIDTAGPRDMADLSKVIDWTIANTGADPSRIGVAGISYGAGISLLGAAFDSRIRVVAMMSGWTDLVYSLYSDSTRHKQSAGLLEIAAGLLGDVGPDLGGKLADFKANRNVPEVMAWARVRSAATYLNALNTNKPAILIANAWGDSFFPPNQLVDFYQRLTTPKRLELRPGDHAIAELGGIFGFENEVWSSVRTWFDTHLATKGTDPTASRATSAGLSAPTVAASHTTSAGVSAPTRAASASAQLPVLIKPDNAPAESYPDWPSLSTTQRRFDLGKIRTLDGTGLLGGGPSPAWTKSLPTDKDTTAAGGVVLLTNGVAAFTNQRPQIWLPTVDRFRAGVWASSRPASPLRLRGIPKVHLDLAGTHAPGSAVVYLYDLDALGTAKLITHAPVTWLEPRSSVDVALSAAAYDIPAGHSLTLVVDTVDPLYYDANAPGETVTIGAGSYLDVPVRS